MNQSPFHNSNAKPLPDANDIEQAFSDMQNAHDLPPTYDLSETQRQHLAADRRRLRNFLLGLLAIGLLIGGILSVGIVWMMGRLDLIEPNQIQQPR